MKYLSFVVLLLIVLLPGCDDEKDVADPVLNMQSVQTSVYYYSLSAHLSNPSNVFITEYGFAYGMTPTPSSGNSTLVSVGGNINGNTSFQYDVPIQVLSNGTYYVRAYVRIKGKTVYSNEVSFINSRSPKILSIEPSQGRPGDLVTITGSNFYGTAAVYFNNVQAYIANQTESWIRVYVPSGLPNGNVTLSVDMGGTRVNSPTFFRVVTAMIKDVTPSSGTWNDVITITGENFPTQNFYVQIGSTICDIVESSPEMIKVKLHPNITETNPTVLVYSQQEYISWMQTFTMLPPEITDFQPRQGDFSDVVTLTGKNFHPVLWRNRIYIGNVEANAIESTPTTIKFQIPANYEGAEGKSKIKAIVSGESESVDDFTLNAHQISSISPTEGVRGTTVTITGQKFNPYASYNKVTIGGIEARILQSSQTQIEVELPYNLARGIQDVSVITGGRTVTSPQQFEFSDPWIARSAIPGNARQRAFSFALNNKGYVGGGFDQSGYLKKDFYMFDPVSDSWVRKADIPINGEGITWFATDSKAYLLRFKELWQYDPVTNKWTSKAEFPGLGIINQVSFSIGNNGYVAGGWISESGGSVYEFFKYDETSNEWTRLQDTPAAFTAGIGMTDGQRGYVAFGNSFYAQLYEYTPSSNSWSLKTVDLLDGQSVLRREAIGMSTQGKIYYGTGNDNYYSWGTRYGDMYEYDPATNSVRRIADVPNRGRQGAVGFTIGTKVYVGGGIVTTESGPVLSNDFYEYDPDYQE